MDRLDAPERYEQLIAFLGSNLPTGPTSFNFSVASLQFTGVIYEWLVVAGDKAQFKGTGTIANDAGNYGFIVTAADGQQNGATGIEKLAFQRFEPTAAVYSPNRVIF